MADITADRLRTGIEGILQEKGGDVDAATVQAELESRLGLEAGSLAARQDEIKTITSEILAKDESEPPVSPGRRRTTARASVTASDRRGSVMEDNTSPDAPADGAAAADGDATADGDAADGDAADGDADGDDADDGEKKDDKKKKKGKKDKDEDDYDEHDDYRRGRNREGETADFEGYLEKKGDKGLLKGWKKRFFRLYKSDGSIAYFPNEKTFKQLGEISLTGAFIIETSTEKKFAFSITMKTIARVWLLNAKSEEDRKAWMDAASEIMRPAPVFETEESDGKKGEKITGLPLRFPPRMDQGFQDITQTVSSMQDADESFDVDEADKETNDVALFLHGDAYAVVQERRELDVADGETWVENLPRSLKSTKDSIHFVPDDDKWKIQWQHFYSDTPTPANLLKRLIGQKVKVTVPTKDNFPGEAEFEGNVVYHPEDESFALHDDSGKVHFLSTKDAHSFDFSGGKVLLPGFEDKEAPAALFQDAQALWSMSDGSDSPPSGKVEGTLTYKLSSSFQWHARYNCVLEPKEKKVSITAWFTVENKTSRPYSKAQLVLATAPKTSKEDKKEAKEADEDKPADDAPKKKGGLFSKLPISPPSLPISIPGLSDLLGGNSAPFIRYYPIDFPVTLPPYQPVQVNLLQQQFDCEVFFLCRHEAPEYTYKIALGESHGASSKAMVKTVMRFNNDSGKRLPAGSVNVARTEKNLWGARHLSTSSIGPHEDGHIVTVDLEDASGISISRKQTGFTYDAEKKFIVETFELTVASSRPEIVDVVIEEVLYRWHDWEITSSYPVHENAEHPRTIRWKVKLNAGEDQLLKYTAFYSNFDA